MLSSLGLRHFLVQGSSIARAAWALDLKANTMVAMDAGHRLVNRKLTCVQIGPQQFLLPPKTKGATLPCVVNRVIRVLY